MTADQIVIEPILTEKSNELRERGVYVFRVSPRANKLQIRAAVATLFGVHPVGCQVMNVRGKPKRTRLARGTSRSWKKAIVTLAAGEKIAVFEGA